MTVLVRAETAYAYGRAASTTVTPQSSGSGGTIGTSPGTGGSSSGGPGTISIITQPTTGGGTTSGGSTTPTPVLPTPPAAPSVSVRAGDGQATLTVTAAAGDVTGYEYSLDGGTTWRALGAGSTTLTGLANGRTVTVLVRGLNTGGAGATTSVSVTPSAKLGTGVSGLGRLRVGVPVDGSAAASGGVAPYTYAVTSGRLPAGLSLDTRSGRVTGTPTDDGAAAFTLTATDAEGTTANTKVSLDVDNATAATLPDIPRGKLAPVPADPAKVTGRKQATKAYLASYKGIDAYPVAQVAGLDLTKGQAATLTGDGLFGFNSAKLTKAGLAQVKTLATSLNGSAKAATCEGYTDYAGTLTNEMKLSTARARTVCKALRAAGAKVATKAVGYGPERLAVIGGSAETRKENRRVVVVVTG